MLTITLAHTCIAESNDHFGFNCPYIQCMCVYTCVDKKQQHCNNLSFKTPSCLKFLYYLFVCLIVHPIQLFTIISAKVMVNVDQKRNSAWVQVLT